MSGHNLMVDTVDRVTTITYEAEDAIERSVYFLGETSKWESDLKKPVIELQYDRRRGTVQVDYYGRTPYPYQVLEALDFNRSSIPLDDATIAQLRRSVWHRKMETGAQKWFIQAEDHMMTGTQPNGRCGYIRDKAFYPDVLAALLQATCEGGTK